MNVTYTVATVVYYDGEHGRIRDAWGEIHWFSKGDVHMLDWRGLKVGVQVLYNSFGLIELATSHLLRWGQEKRRA